MRTSPRRPRPHHTAPPSAAEAAQRQHHSASSWVEVKVALALLTLLAISVLLIVRGIRDPDEIGGATVGVLTLVGMAAMTFMTGNEPARSPEDDSHNGTVDQ